MHKFIHIAIFLMFSILWNSSKAQALFDVETGIVSTGYNDVRIPNNGGTFFSLKDDLNPKSKLFYRLRASYTLKSRVTISLLYAPLEMVSNGSLTKDIIFRNDTFTANNNINAVYKFNSYRLTTRVNIINQPKIIFGLGFTAKVRDAKISLSNSFISTEEKSVGMVPIINFYFWRRIKDKFGLFLIGDALFASRGRAADIHIAGTYKYSDNITLRAGYRFLEGGSNGRVYGFALFHYGSVGISYTINNKEQNEI